MAASNMITFWSPNHPNAYLGQWYMSDFELNRSIYLNLPESITSLNLCTDKPNVLESIIGSHFNCAEQFMMVGKAHLFEDVDVANLISQELDPSKHRKLGRQIKNFDQNTWDLYSDSIVIIGNYLKFTQNPDILQKLKDTKNNILVEGSPYDRVWGVGLRYNDPKIFDKRNWRGSNKLGNCLMKVRDIV